VCNTECKLYVHTDTTTDYNDKRLTNDRPDLSSERAPQIRHDCNLKKKKSISGQKSQIGLDTKTDWLTVSNLTWLDMFRIVTVIRYALVSVSELCSRWRYCHSHLTVWLVRAHNTKICFLLSEAKKPSHGRCADWKAAGPPELVMPGDSQFWAWV
jgi:hypothetical protein